jgi:hypothetical protein
MQTRALARTLDLIFIPAALISIIGITLGLCLFDASPTRTARERIVVVRAPAVRAPTVELRSQAPVRGGACECRVIAARAAR